MYAQQRKLFLLLNLIALTSTVETLNRNYMSENETYKTSLALEMSQSSLKKIGNLIVICGSMCCGKTEELIRIVSRQYIADKSKVQTFKPLLDTRQLKNSDKDPSRFVTSRNGSSIECVAVQNVEQMKAYILEHNISIIAVDEAQFFNKQNFISFVHEMVDLGKKVIIAGLDLDFRAEPFGPMGDLLAYADNVIKLTAICKKCGQDTYCISQRLINNEPAHYNDPIVMVGESQYEPRCRKCHIIRKD